MAAPVIGVFDSGIGGLSVLRALRAAMPGARYHYLADNAWAPYGERAADALRGRIATLVRAWRAEIEPDLLVLACNSATAVAIDALREEHPDLPIVGIEPAVRPALGLTRSGQVGVLATRATLQSERYHALRDACLAVAGPGLQIHDHAADGLADAIERNDETAVTRLCRSHLHALLTRAPAIDTLVLGCTHYPLVDDAWRAAWAKPLHLVDPAEAVARRAASLLGTLPQLDTAPGLLWQCTGDTAPLAQAAQRWLGLHATVLRPAFAD
jgi:glutamate racemase